MELIPTLEFGRVSSLYHLVSLLFWRSFDCFLFSSSPSWVGVIRGVQPQQLAEQGVSLGCCQGCGGSGEPGADEK